MPVRVLCLHGDRQTSDVFRNQLSKLHTVLGPGAALQFLDAPWELPLQCDGSSALAMRSWRSPGATEPALTAEGSEVSDDTRYRESDQLVKQVIEDELGGCDFLLGFSQGALVSQRYLMQHAIAAAAGGPPMRLKGAIFSGSPDPRKVFPALTAAYIAASRSPDESGAAPAVPPLFGIPTLHIVGRKDEVVRPEESIAFAEACGQLGRLVLHDHAHSTPALQAITHAIQEFLTEHSVDPTEQVALDEARHEELQMISAMFGEECVLRASGPGHTNTVVLPVVDDAESSDGCGTSDAAQALATLKAEFTVSRSYPEELPGFCLRAGEESRRTAYLRWHSDLVSELQTYLGDLRGTPMLLPALMFVRDFVLKDGGGEYIELVSMCRGGSVVQGAATAADEAPSQDEWALDETDAEQRMAWIHAAHTAAQRLTAAEGLTDSSDSSKGAASVAEGGSPGAAASGGGTLNITVGLIGKPSAGKSTFFNAVTDPESESGAARVAAHPFTTIDPNVGTGFGPVFCPCQRVSVGNSKVTCEASYGHVDACGATHRRHPIVVKDVAGLVRGAYLGRGKGNRFLNDLCDADVLVHVVDGAGATDADGVACAPGAGSALEDITWVRNEVHCWIFDNVLAKWESVRRKPVRLRQLFTGYQCSPHLVDRVFEHVKIRNDADIANRVPWWGPQDLHLFIALFVQLRFPIVIAINKADIPTTHANYDALVRAHPHETFVPMSAKVEWNLLQLRKAGIVMYLSGEKQFKELISAAAAPGGMSKSHSSMLEHARRFFSGLGSRPAGAPGVSPYGVGTTGVQNVLAKALARCRATLVFPMTSLKPQLEGSLRHCLAFKAGSTADDVFWAMCRAGLLDGMLVRFEALDASSPKAQVSVLRKDELLPWRLLLVRVLSNKRNPLGITTRDGVLA